MAGVALLVLWEHCKEKSRVFGKFGRDNYQNLNGQIIATCLAQAWTIQPHFLS